jgi:hypothetical protein
MELVLNIYSVRGVGPSRVWRVRILDPYRDSKDPPPPAPLTRKRGGWMPLSSQDHRGRHYFFLAHDEASSPPSSSRIAMTKATSSSSTLPPPIVVVPRHRYLLPLVITLLSLLLPTTKASTSSFAVAAATATATEEDDVPIGVLLEGKRNELRLLQNAFDVESSRISDFVRAYLEGDDGLIVEGGGIDVTISEMQDDMDAIIAKSSELARRTEALSRRVLEINRRTLMHPEGGGGGIGMDAGDGRGGVEGAIALSRRLEGVLEDEARRRDRYRIAVESTSPPPESKNANNASRATVTLDELRDILSPLTTSIDDVPKRVNDDYDDYESSEHRRYHPLAILAEEMMGDVVAMMDDALVERTRRAHEMYDDIEGGGGGGGGGKASHGDESSSSSSCLGVTDAMLIVGRALREHHNDGTNGLVDHARIENGGCVVHELTSSPYVPPPRIGGGLVGAGDGGGGGGSGRRSEGGYYYMEEEGRRRTFDDETEEAYWQDHRHQRTSGRGDTSIPTMTTIVGRLFENIRESNAWGWYASFEFGAIRPYLPEDWERALDDLFSHPPSWSTYTPRAALDALIPDYVYHAWGVSNDPGYGTRYGRTAHPNVAISSGGVGLSRGGDVGDGFRGGWTAKPSGHCYPLSMRPDDDPWSSSSSFLGSSSILVGPKYTVKLPYPIHIDAVTLEHRSFPISRRDSERGLRGGESAPRWVRVVGFPPCPGWEGRDEKDEADEGLCAMRGFDVDAPIDLGSFEYRRITVTGREDDYGGGSGNEDGGDGTREEDDFSLQGSRRRSIQTFAVKGGRWKPSSLLAGDDATSSAIEEEKENVSEMITIEDAPGVLTPGQCSPPKDEDSLPSCGGDDTTASTSDGPGYQRKVVEAVSFIVDENWGNAEYTCLYRLRVHGDAVLV